MSALIALPDVYARAKVGTLLERLARDRASWERWGARYLPGVPLEALVGLSATSAGPTERGGAPDYVVGLINVEAATVRAWRADGSMARELGREVDVDDAGSFSADTDAQIALGLRGYAQHHDAVARTGLVAVGVDPWSVWDYRVAALGYIVGDAGARAQLAPAAGLLARLAPGGRWGVLSLAIAEAPGASWGSRPVAGRWQAAFAQLRVDQRWECGRLLASRRGSALGWWGAVDEAVWAQLEARAGAPSSPGSGDGSDGGGGLVLAVLAGLFWWLRAGAA